MHSRTLLRRAACAVACGAVTALLGLDGVRAGGPRFLPDDPLWIDNDRVNDATGAREIRLDDRPHRDPDVVDVELGALAAPGGAYATDRLEAVLHGTLHVGLHGCREQIPDVWSLAGHVGPVMAELLAQVRISP